MKNIIKFSVLSFLAVSTLVACGDASKSAASSLADIKKEEISTATRSLKDLTHVQTAASFSLAAANLDKSKIEQIMLTANKANDNADAEFINTLFSNLQAAENNAAVLTTATFKVAEETIENDLFIFSLDSQVEQSLTFEMFDEEGFKMAANNTLGLSKGNNYKAINVASIEDGNYIVRVKNTEGQELVQKISIKR